MGHEAEQPQRAHRYAVHACPAPRQDPRCFASEPRRGLRPGGHGQSAMRCEQLRPTARRPCPVVQLADDGRPRTLIGSPVAHEVAMCRVVTQVPHLMRLILDVRAGCLSRASRRPHLGEPISTSRCFAGRARPVPPSGRALVMLTGAPQTAWPGCGRRSAAVPRASCPDPLLGPHRPRTCTSRRTTSRPQRHLAVLGAAGRAGRGHGRQCVRDPPDRAIRRHDRRRGEQRGAGQV
jgi:hypothetical protein